MGDNDVGHVLAIYSLLVLLYEHLDNGLDSPTEILCRIARLVWDSGCFDLVKVLPFIDELYTA